MFELSNFCPCFVFRLYTSKQWLQLNCFCYFYVLELCDDNKMIIEFVRFANTHTKRRIRKMEHGEKYGFLTHFSYCFEIGISNSCCICPLLTSHQSPSNYHIVVYCTHQCSKQQILQVAFVCNKINNLNISGWRWWDCNEHKKEKRKSLVIRILFLSLA